MYTINELLPATRSLVKYYSEGSEAERAALLKALWAACRRAAQQAGGAAFDQVLAAADPVRISEIKALAETAAAGWTKPTDETQWLLVHSFAAIALMCHHRTDPLSAGDIDLLRSVAKLYALAKVANEEHRKSER